MPFPEMDTVGGMYGTSEWVYLFSALQGLMLGKLTSLHVSDPGEVPTVTKMVAARECTRLPLMKTLPDHFWRGRRLYLRGDLENPLAAMLLVSTVLVFPSCTLSVTADNMEVGMGPLHG